VHDCVGCVLFPTVNVAITVGPIGVPDIFPSSDSFGSRLCVCLAPFFECCTRTCDTEYHVRRTEQAECMQHCVMHPLTVDSSGCVPFCLTISHSNAPSNTNGVRIQVSESIDGGKARVVYKGQDEKGLDYLSTIRLVLLPSSNQKFTFTVQPIGSVSITLRELLSENAASAGFKLKPLPKDGEDVSAIADELYSSSSPSAAAAGGPTLRLNVVGGVGTVISAARQGERSILGRDVSRQESSASTPSVRGASTSASAIQPGHHGDLKFKEHPTFSSSSVAQQAVSPKAGRTFELQVGVKNIPALDSVSGVHPLVAAFGKNGSILSHSELGSIGQGSVEHFATRLLIGESDIPISLSVFDTTGEEELSTNEHEVGKSEKLTVERLEELVQSGESTSFPLSNSKKPGVEKKLRKRDSSVLVHSVRLVGGGNPLSPNSKANAKGTVNRAPSSVPVSKESFAIRTDALIFIDSKGKEHSSASLSSPKASSPKSSTGFNLSATGLPKLDPLRDERNFVGVAWEVSANGEILKGHTELSSDANPSFQTPLSLSSGDSDEKSYRIDIHDLSDERASSESLIGSLTISSKELNELKNKDEFASDLTTENGAIQKKLSKKLAKAYLARSGASDEVLKARTVARANGGKFPVPKVETPKAAPAVVETPKSSAAAAPVESPKAAAIVETPKAGESTSSSAPAPVQTDASSSSSSETISPSSPQHLAEQEAVGVEAKAVSQELAAKQRLAAAQQVLHEMKPLPQGKKDSKATLARQQAEKELAEAQAANELATKHATEARANLAAKRQARIAEEDRLRALAEAERAANPNMTLWGERKRGGSVMNDTGSTSGTGIDQVAAARRAQAASGSHGRGGELLLLKLSITGTKAIGAWKPLVGVYGDASASESSFLDHTEKLDIVQEDGSASFSRPILIESGSDASSSSLLRFHLFNQSGDKSTLADLIASSSIDLATLAKLEKGQELVLPLRAGQKALADRLKRQEASVIIVLAGRSSSAGSGSVIPSNAPIPSTLPSQAGLSVDTDAPKHTVRQSASYVVSPVAEEVAALAAEESKDVPASATSAQSEPQVEAKSDVPAESPAGSPAASDDEGEGGASKGDKKKKKKVCNRICMTRA
jgi:hypothetical protein